MRRISPGLIGLSVLALVLQGCSRKPATVTQLQHYSLNDLSGLVAEKYVEVDREISSDGNGSLRITATGPATIPLFEIGDLDIENARLIYRAMVRTEDVNGPVYLEMLCRFPGLGEFFSRDVETPVTGTTEWSAEETPFFLQEGQNPDNVKLNLIIEGTGTVWIDDIHLLKGPLEL